jgi:hypothetical protein
MKTSSDTIWNRTSDLPIGGILPHVKPLILRIKLTKEITDTPSQMARQEQLE